jgi:translation initiation factor 3 subunit K
MSKHFQLTAGESKVVSACEEQIRSDPYNADHIAQLELSVADQVAKQLYSFDSNIALLKLYQFNPDQLKEDIVEKILAKVEALARLWPVV